MLKLLALSLCLAFIMATPVLGQKCPGSDRTLVVLVQNGTEAKNVRYQMHPIMPLFATGDFEGYLKYLSEMFRLTKVEASEMANGNLFPRVLSDEAEKIIKEYKAEEYKPVVQYPMYDLSGPVKDGKVVFKASEAVRQLLLLKVTSDNFYPEYIAGDFLGGCGSVVKVELSKFRIWSRF